MKTIAGALETHLQQTTTTLAICWKITSTGGTILGFTNHPSDLVVSGVTYRAAYGFSPSSVDTNAGLAVDNLDVKGLFNVSGLALADIQSGKWDYATVEVFLVNYSSVSDGTIKIRKGTVGEFRLDRQNFMAEIRGLFQAYSRQIVELYSPACRADLGDTRCGVTIGTYTVAGTVTAVTSKRVFVDTGRTEASDYFNGGLLTWTGGVNSGRAMEVKDWTNGSKTFELVLPMLSTIAVGDTYSVYAGCDKTLATCRDKFNNVVNFRGEPYVPASTKVALVDR